MGGLGAATLAILLAALGNAFLVWYR